MVSKGSTAGVAPLDDWLKRRARPNSASGASHTYACEGDKVVAYYALAAGAVAPAASPGRFRQEHAGPDPVVVLESLAIDRAYQGQGLGRALFRDASLRGTQAADVIRVRRLLVDAISEEAESVLSGARHVAVTARSDDADGHARRSEGRH